MALKKVASLGDLSGKTVLVRINLDVIGESPSWRLDFSIPFLKNLSSQGAKVILISHRGRPGGKYDQSLSLKSFVPYLEENLGSVSFGADIIGEGTKEKASNLKSGEFLLLENLRFNPGEESNDSEFARELALLADFYINEDFATSHRAHVSLVGVPKLIESAAGPIIEREIAELSLILKANEKPLIFLLGGAKVETKLNLVRNLLDKADYILIGGVLANTFLKAKGFEIGRSLVGKIEDVEDIKSHPKIILPSDFIVSRSLKEPAEVSVKLVNEIVEGDYIVDIGPQSSRAYVELLGSAARSVWNGPVGLFEIDEFKRGSLACADAMAQSAARTTVGGEDTVQFLSSVGMLKKMEYISTGGGAMLEFLAGKELPGLKVLRCYDI